MVKKTSLVALLVLITAGTVFGAYSGAYVVGPTGYFPSPYVAGESIRTYGMSGNVTFNIQAGTYTQTAYVNLNTVSGSGTYTMTWQPQNPGDVVTINSSATYGCFYMYYTDNVKILNLTLNGTGSYALDIDYYARWCRVEGCVIRAPSGIYFYNYPGYDSIIRNDIKVTSSYGIYFASGYGYNEVIIGNLIGGWTSYGIYEANSYYSRIMYNTIVGTGSYAIYRSTAYYDTIRDNIFQANSYAMYTSGAYMPDSSDYNCYWLNGGSSSSTVIYYNSTAYTLAAWKTANPTKDIRSIQYNPNTAAPANLRLRTGSPCIDSGNRPYSYPPPCAACTLDVDGINRNYNGTPDIGASEYAGLTAMSGIYHIKPGVTRADTYPSFAASLNAASLRGLNGNVTFHVMAGTYSEGQLNFSNPGNGPYWITWMPDAAGVQPVFDAGGASYAIYAALGCKRLRWQGLKIQNFTSYGFYLYVNTGVTPYYTPDSNCVKGNTINGPNGIYFYSYYGGSDDSFVNNVINATSSYGIYAYGYTSTTYIGYRNVYIGNMISGWTSYGIYLYGYNYYPKLLYNTLVGTGSYALYEYYGYYDTLVGNIMQAGSYAWYRYYGNTYPDYSNYNCFWLNGGSTSSSVIANQGTAYTLASWRTASNKDANSLQWDPKTGAPQNPHLKNGSPCIDSGGSWPGINLDVDGNTRPYGAYTDIGADEWNNTIGSPMNGVYTVKQAGGGDYASVIDAVADLALRGNSGNVQFDVYAGTYSGMVNLNSMNPTPYRLILRAYPGQNAVLTGGGSYGVYFYNTKKVHLEGFSITGFTSYGIYMSSYYSNLNNSDSNAIVGNTITGVNGISCNYGNVDTFARNFIHVTSSYGIYLYGYSGTPYGYLNVIYNNAIDGAASYGIYSYYQNGLTVAYNSFNMTSSYGWYDYYNYGLPSYYPMRIRDNIFMAGTYAWYFYYFNGSTTIYPDSSDYNDFRLTGAGASPIAFSGTAYTVPGWTTMSARDSHSLNVAPAFVAGNDEHLTSTSPCRGAGIPFAGITTDFEGNTRSYQPCMGCDEFYADVACRSVIAPAGLIPVQVAVTPRAAFKYLSGQGSTPYKAFLKLVRKTGGTEVYRDSALQNANVGDSAAISFTPWTPTIPDTYYTTAWCRVPGDGNPGNDTAKTAFKVGNINCGVISIVAPSGAVGLGQVIYPQVRLHNYGDFQATMIVNFTLNDATFKQPRGKGGSATIAGVNRPAKSQTAAAGKAGTFLKGGTPLGALTPGKPGPGTDSIVYDETRIWYLNPGAESTYRYSSSWTATPGVFATRCSLWVANDQAPVNDTMSGSCTVSGHDVGCTVVKIPVGSIDSGVPVTPTCSLYNYGNLSENYNARMKIGSVYNQTTAVASHGSHAFIQVTFPNWTPVTRGGLFVSCSTELSSDNVNANDRASDSVTVITHDVAPIRIVAPRGTLDSGTAVTPACTLFNYGLSAETYNVRLTIGTRYDNTVAVASHAPRTKRYVTFPSWTALERGALAVACSTQLAGDGEPDNDLLTGDVQVNAYDVGSTNLMAPTGGVLLGTVVTPRCSVYNFGTTTRTFPVRMRIGTTYNQSASVTLQPDDGAEVLFYEWTASTLGTFAVTCSTEMAVDGNRPNDARRDSVHVLNTLADVGCTRILAPLGTLDSGTAVTPACSVYNYGSGPATYNIRMRLGPAQLVRSVSGHAPGTRLYVTFGAWSAMPRGTVAVACTTELPGDVTPDNDAQYTNLTILVRDVGATQISPIGNMFPDTVSPRAHVRNYGTQRDAATATFLIASAPPYTQTLNFPSGLPDLDTTLIFPSWHAIVGNYTPKCSVYCANDLFRANNVFTGSLHVLATDTGWVVKAPLPSGGKAKNVKDGGALTYQSEGTDAPVGYIYSFKGNNRYEYYKYNTATNTWATKESIPAIGKSGKKKAVKKGSVLVSVPSATDATGNVYGAKGNNSLEWWQYQPGTDAAAWKQMTDFPAGAKALKEGVGAAVVKRGDTSFVYMMRGSGTQDFYRYNTTTNTWTVRASLPTGVSGKPYKDGSCMAASTDGKTIYAVKGSYNEFYSYSADSNVWKTLTALPMSGRSGKKTKIKGGAGMAFYNGGVYVLKGNNTTEFWKYRADSGRWIQLGDMPLGGGKKVKGGAGIVYSPDPIPALFALKGNNTLEFWRYNLGSSVWLDDRGSSNALSGAREDAVNAGLRVSPNPFTNATTINYSLARAGNVTLKLYDVTGKLLATLASGYRNAGTSFLVLRPAALSSGIYLLKLETENSTTTSKLIIE